MSNHDMTIDYNGGAPKFNPTPGPTDLHVNDTVTLQLSGFPTGSIISNVEFFGSKIEGGADKKDTTVNRGNSSSPGPCGTRARPGGLRRSAEPPA